MPGYLLTWNPKTSYQFTDLAERAAAVARLGSIAMRWSSGRRKTLPVGSRVFFLRQGFEPRGIYGTGTTTSEPFEDVHWDTSREGAKALYVDVDVDYLVDAENDPSRVLATHELSEPLLRDINWNTQASGIEISDAATHRIYEKLLGKARKAFARAR